MLSLMVLEMATVTIIVLTHCACNSSTILSVVLLATLCLTHLLLIPLLLLLLHLLCVIGTSILVQVKVQSLASLEALVCFWNRSLFTLDLLNLFKMLFQMFARIWRAIPALCLIDDSSNSFVLDDRIYVDGIVHATENAVLVRVFHVEVVKELEPQCFKLVRVVLEQVKVIAHC